MIGAPHTLNANEAAQTAQDLIDPSDVELANNLGIIFGQLSGRDAADFLHMDPSKVTVGRAQPSPQSAITVIEKIACDGAAFGALLRLDSCDFVKFDLDSEEPGKASEHQTGQLYVALSRNVYSADIDCDHRERAIDRALTSDEPLLVVGDLGIESFAIHAIQRYGTVTGEDADAALRKRAALAGALDALKDLRAPALEA